MREMTTEEVTKSQGSRFYRRLKYFFIVDSGHLTEESEKLYSSAIGWCWDQYGPAQCLPDSVWDCYSMVVGFREIEQAVEFKMRWG
jgi:hypothetical protein